MFETGSVQIWSICTYTIRNLGDGTQTYTGNSFVSDLPYIHSLKVNLHNMLIILCMKQNFCMLNPQEAKVPLSQSPPEGGQDRAAPP